jgi:hypothetical protein
MLYFIPSCDLVDPHSVLGTVHFVTALVNSHVCPVHCQLCFAKSLECAAIDWQLHASIFAIQMN